MYHRFPHGPAALPHQCEHIRRHYHPVSLTDVAESLRGGTPLPANAVAVTVDDGYRDFVTEAHPVFRAYNIPTAVFVVTDFLDGARWLWHDAVAYALAQTRRRDLSIDRVAFCERLKNVPVPERERAVASLLLQLEVELPRRPPDDYAPMTWDDARRIAADGVEIGVHTKSHPILSQVQDRDRLREEIVAPKARVESELGRPARHFCYPNGRRQDSTPEVVDPVRTTGYLTAVTTERGINFAGTTPFLLRRLGAEPDNPMPYFAELLAGVRTS
jgi:peptidoglycan/xylan/chitin deacetylase (PgdA/CDA1 family)